jgi:hypothetical protein
MSEVDNQIKNDDKYCGNIENVDLDEENQFEFDNCEHAY